MARTQAQVRKTLLVVGEGDSECAFIKHLRALYCSGGAGVAVTVRNAHGKGPEHVVDYAAGQARIYSYDARVALLDTDIPWTDKLKKEARKAKVVMVGSSPCLEGLLLAILGKRRSAQSADCKKTVQQLLSLDLTDWHGYAEYFSKALLESARTTIAELNQLLVFFEGSERLKKSREA
ncbi:MAG: RloB domain-containing protein [Pseudomonadota bacterium]